MCLGTVLSKKALKSTVKRPYGSHIALCVLLFFLQRLAMRCSGFLSHHMGMVKISSGGLLNKWLVRLVSFDGEGMGRGRILRRLRLPAGARAGGGGAHASICGAGGGIACGSLWHDRGRRSLPATAWRRAGGGRWSIRDFRPLYATTTERQTNG